MLELTGLTAAHGSSQVLFGVDLSLPRGSVLALMGRNGMGKTTTIRRIMGLMKHRNGRITLDGEDMTQWPPARVAHAGIGLVPEGRRIFPNLTVRENLIAMAMLPRPGNTTAPWTLDRVLELFPRLAERLSNMGTQLSGGEQQMLALGRALMTNPRLLILDEATEGLAPLARQEIWACLARLKAEGLSILVVDKHVDVLAELADHHAIMEKGCIAWRGTGQDVLDPAVKSRWLGV
ncbi:MAG: ABC transporter ATP-binding protein [Rhodospirillum sp.]|nr:ABC transporter ATP-binding protein [Rhodospirillum sp.]MCF8488933.1 ABC transporter ATP-binding protein [Rhodospirillum sp.]MCF8498989.1 ABC transporter ATP-binding protein [Rhodospirillum sp.]